jgi:hypothetical protein
MRFAALLIGAGLLLIGVLGWHGASAYLAISAIDTASRVETPNPLFLLNELTSSGIRMSGQIDPRSRAAYTAALEQFVLDGSGVLIGIVCLGGGLFVRAVSGR